MNGRMTEVVYNGRPYQIPDLWLAGFCSAGPAGHSRTLMDAVAWWVYQEDLKEQEESAK